jgi:hypothetical protein
MAAPKLSCLCPSCGYWLPADAFTPRRYISGAEPCIPCQQETRDARKLANRWVVKARTTRRSHARRLGISVPTLEHDYGWELVRIAGELEHAYAGNCPGCGQAFAEMPNGIQDLTVDVIDRDAAPVWGVNTRPLCQTDNRRKGITTTAKRAAIELAYRVRRGQPAAARLFEMDRVIPRVRPEPTPRPMPQTDQLPLGSVYPK